MNTKKSLDHQPFTRHWLLIRRLGYSRQSINRLIKWLLEMISGWNVDGFCLLSFLVFLWFLLLLLWCCCYLCCWSVGVITPRVNHWENKEKDLQSKRQFKLNLVYLSMINWLIDHRFNFNFIFIFSIKNNQHKVKRK